MGKKKIAILSFYSGDVYRGVETFVHELANRLVGRGHEVVVYQHGPSLPNSLYKTITIDIPVDWAKKSSYIPFVNYWALGVRKFTEIVLNRLDSDTEIVFPTNGQWQSLLCKFWAIKHKKKMVISGQSGPGLDDRLNLFTFPDIFVGLTDFQINWAKKANFFVKTEKIPNGVDLKQFGHQIKPINIDLPRPIILCVAAFDFWKRLDLIIKAVSKLKKGSLLLAGRGEEQRKLQSLGDKLLGSRFKMMSFSHYKMPHVYTVADIFTYSTIPWESFGIVLVEAMASGLAVVANDDPIRREIVGDAGLFVDPTNIDKYAQTLERALRADWANKPRKQAEKFSWDKISNAYEKLFLDLYR